MAVKRPKRERESDRELALEKIVDHVDGSVTIACLLACSRKGCKETYEKTHRELYTLLSAERVHAQEAVSMGWRYGRRGPICPRHSGKRRRKGIFD